MTDYWLMPLVGFLTDTTLAAAKLAFSGVVQRFPGIRWVLAHLGGAIPYLAERLDRGFEAFKECRRNIDRPPSEYLRKFYFDTVNFDPAALRLAIGFAGVDHIFAGSDYPHQIGSLGKNADQHRRPGTSSGRQGKDPWREHAKAVGNIVGDKNTRAARGVCFKKSEWVASRGYVAPSTRSQHARDLCFRSSEPRGGEFPALAELARR